MEEKNKKALVPTIIAVVTLVLLTVGGTYAYFRVATDNNFGTPKIDASTPSIGSVALSTGSNLTMNLTAEQMMKKDTSVTYYASPSGTTTEEYTENIGTATVTGEGSYICTYKLTIDDNENSLYDKFQTGYAYKSTGQVILTVNGVEYDFNTAGLFPKEISGTMTGLTSVSPRYITAQLKLVNTSYRNQSDLAGQNITLEFEVSDFSCTAVEEQEPQPAVQYILANASEDELWDSTLEDDGYRYIGEDPDNYVCFGYTNKGIDCDFTNAENIDKYAYRVIGIFEDSNGVEHVKLIKKESIGEYAWNEDVKSDVNWSESTLFNKLNGDAFLTNTTYISTGWSDKIAPWEYTMTTASFYAFETPPSIYLHEMNRSSKTNTNGEWGTARGKVSLIYISDYVLSEGTRWFDDYEFGSNNMYFETGWMYIRSYEWTMTRSGYYEYEEVFEAWPTLGWSDYVGAEFAVRPIFHLTSDTTMNGAGTIENPFIVYK